MTTIDAHWLSDVEAETLLRQIGQMNVFAISGGRVVRGTNDDIILPVRHNIDVRIQYLRGWDLYLVQRVRRIVRGKRKGELVVEREDNFVGAEQVGTLVYRASLDH